MNLHLRRHPDVYLDPGAVLPPLDCTAPHLWQLKSGVLLFEVIDNEVPMPVVRLAHPGDLVGDEALSGQPSPHRARALTPVRLSAVSLSAQTRPHLLAQVLEQQRTRALEMTALRQGPVASRVGLLHALLVQAVTEPASAQPEQPPLKDLARIVDSAPETVCRALKTVRQQAACLLPTQPVSQSFHAAQA